MRLLLLVALAWGASQRRQPVPKLTLPARPVASALPLQGVQAGVKESVMAKTEALVRGLGQAPVKGGAEQQQSLELHFTGAKLQAPSDAVAGADSAPIPLQKAQPRRLRDRLLPPDVPLKVVGLAASWNFLTIMAYSVIGPVRGALVADLFSAQALPYVFLISALLTAGAVMLYGKLSSLPREKFVGGSLAVLAASFLVWSGMAFTMEFTKPMAAAFYMWGDLFGIMGVTLMWSYLNDAFKSEQAKKVFGLITLGASIGGLLGFWLTGAFIKSLGAGPVLLIAGLGFSLTLLIFKALPSALATAKASTAGAWQIIRSSKLLGLLAALVLLERLVPDFGNYLFMLATKEAFPGRAELTQALAYFGLWQNVGSMLLGLTFSAVALRYIGLTGALMTAALVNLVGMGLFPLWPALGLVLGFSALDGMMRYTWFKSAKETAYTVGDKTALYKVKGWIDMFVYRFGRVAASVMLILVAPLGLEAVALAGAALAAVWLWTAWRLGREVKNLERGESPK